MFLGPYAYDPNQGFNMIQRKSYIFLIPYLAKIIFEKIKKLEKSVAVCLFLVL